MPQTDTQPELRGATRADLDSAPANAFLYCPDCGARYSATPGDYWQSPADHAFTCEHGEDPQDLPDGPTPMILAVEQCAIVPVAF